MGFSSNLHHSARTGRWQRCVAIRFCPYGEHRSTLDLARAGGAEISTHGHSKVQTVSPVIGGVFSVGTGKRSQTFTTDGKKLSSKEARAWRNRLKRMLKKAAKASKRRAKQQAKRAVNRTILRAKWAAQDAATGVIAGIGGLITATAEEFDAEFEKLAAEFGGELEAQLTAFDELWNPPGADC